MSTKMFCDICEKQIDRATSNVKYMFMAQTRPPGTFTNGNTPILVDADMCETCANSMITWIKQQQKGSHDYLH